MKTFASFAVVFSLFGCLTWPDSWGRCLDPNVPCIPDFSITANPAAVTSNAGAAAASTITVSPANGFSGTVSLTVAGTPAGASASFSPTAHIFIHGDNGGVATLTLQPGTAAAGTYNLTVTGTSGSVNHTATVVWTIA